MNRKRDHFVNHFGTMPTAYYNAIYQDGQFINQKTGEPIELKDGARVRIQMLRSNVLDKDFERHIEYRQSLLCEAGEELTFNIKSSTYRLRLLEDLLLVQQGNRRSKLSAATCEVYQVSARDMPFIDIPPIEVNSLNQAYTQTSLRYFPEKKSHNGNAFKVMRHKGVPLEEFRAF